MEEWTAEWTEGRQDRRTDRLTAPARCGLSPNAKGVREEDALLENGSQSNESDDTSTERGPEPPSPLKETSFSIGLQVLFPFLLAGFGTVAAGMVLDIVQVGLGWGWMWCRWGWDGAGGAGMVLGWCR
uniref:Solute carrier family 41 member n=1 Tax=Junco hyemalis TaxID=40217 RepID=A0A8C5NT07_JUNHY